MAKLICIKCRNEQLITKEFYNNYVSKSPMTKQKCDCGHEMELTSGFFLDYASPY